MPRTNLRSRHHAADRQTERHCVALVYWGWPTGWSTHLEVYPRDSRGQVRTSYYHAGAYFGCGVDDEKKAREAFADRADRFERRFWKHLEPA